MRYLPFHEFAKHNGPEITFDYDLLGAQIVFILFLPYTHQFLPIVFHSRRMFAAFVAAVRAGVCVCARLLRLSECGKEKYGRKQENSYEISLIRL